MRFFQKIRHITEIKIFPQKVRRRNYHVIAAFIGLSGRIYFRPKDQLIALQMGANRIPNQNVAKIIAAGFKCCQDRLIIADCAGCSPDHNSL